MTTWECFVCEKRNVAEVKQCVCCGRARSFAPHSRVDVTRAKPLALHGLVTAQHELHPALVAALARSGLDLAATDSAGWTALHCAAQLGDATAMRCLLQCDGQESSKTATIVEAALSTGGWRALHLAVRGGHLAVVEELVLAGADVDARLAAGDDALTPLHLAATHGHAEILELLLQCGGDPMLQTQHLHRSVLHVAVMESQERCVRLLLSSACNGELLALRDADGFTALQLSALLAGHTSAKSSNAAQKEILRLLETQAPLGPSFEAVRALQRPLLG